MSENYILTISCPDKIGIVSAVTTSIAEHKGNIMESSQHSEESTNTFFMRVKIDKNTLIKHIDPFQKEFSAIADKFTMQWELKDASKKKRMIVMASKQSHCISDLLYRWRSGDLFCDIPCVISNHNDMRDYVEWHDIPYFHVPMSHDNKSDAFKKIEKIIEAHDMDLVALARFMQIVPTELCEKYFGQIINIHHSFLPAFVGANPYKKAFEKGVKLVGATCHYVTDKLDEGPIIEQDVIRIHHGHSEQDIRRLGKDVEKSVLARGVQYHLQDKVIIHGNKTVIL